jgi:hypothetical protein
MAVELLSERYISFDQIAELEGWSKVYEKRFKLYWSPNITVVISEGG